MEFDDAPPTACTEAVYSGNLLDDPAVMKRVYTAYDPLRAAAPSPEASLTLIESAGKVSVGGPVIVVGADAWTEFVGSPRS